MRAPGPLVARLLLLIVPAALGVGAGLAGAAASLLSRAGVITVAAGAIAGAIAAEVLDLHVFRLHTEVGLAAFAAVHVPAFLFLAGGLILRLKLPEAVFAPCADHSSLSENLG